MGPANRGDRIGKNPSGETRGKQRRALRGPEGGERLYPLSLYAARRSGELNERWKAGLPTSFKEKEQRSVVLADKERSR